MAVDIEQVRGMAHAFVSTISGATPTEREVAPSEQFCDRYNQILSFAKEAMPNVDQRLWPQPIERQDIAKCRYIEIQTYALQILNTLPPKPRPTIGEIAAQAQSRPHSRW